MVSDTELLEMSSNVYDSNPVNHAPLSELEEWDTGQRHNRQREQGESEEVLLPRDWRGNNWMWLFSARYIYTP